MHLNLLSTPRTGRKIAKIVVDFQRLGTNIPSNNLDYVVANPTAAVVVNVLNSTSTMY